MQKGWISKLGNWSHLNYWSSGEWQVVEERLIDYEKSGRTFCPSRNLLFRSLQLVSPGEVRVCIMGQDPYPNPAHASGVAFSVPPSVRSGDLPPTLKNIFAEYSSDLGYPTPKNGDLTKWCDQGVLLWNAYPSCFKGRPGSHHWPEWELLTNQIIGELDAQSRNNPVVFVLLGNSARKFSRVIQSPCIQTSHPSPLGAKSGFLGSRIFSQVNQYYNIDWRLDDGLGGREGSED